MHYQKPNAERADSDQRENNIRKDDFKMKNDPIIDVKTQIKAVTWYQKQGYMHELTCGKDSNHDPLYAVEENREVILRCKNCDYVQNFIPEAVITAYQNRNIPTSIEFRKKISAFKKSS